MGGVVQEVPGEFAPDQFLEEMLVPLAVLDPPGGGVPDRARPDLAPGEVLGEPRGRRLRRIVARNPIALDGPVEETRQPPRRRRLADREMGGDDGAPMAEEGGAAEGGRAAGGRGGAARGAGAGAPIFATARQKGE